MTVDPTPTHNLIHRYQRLIEISRDLASTLDLDTLLSNIVSVAAELSGAEAASILLVDEASQQLYFQTSTTLDELPIMRGMAIPSQGSLAGWVIEHRQPVIANDVQNDLRHYESVDNVTRFSTSSLMGIPLITKDKIIGVLEVLNKLDGEFSPEDQEVMTILGAQAAVAIQNSRLFHQSDLIAEIVHELRTPLSSLAAIAYLLVKPDISEEQRAKLAAMVNSEVQRLNSMATSFLDLARLESGRAAFQKSVFDILSLIEECVNLCETKAAENNLSIRIERSPNLTKIEADRDKLKQVLLNLISNAIKYNRPGGSITFRAGTANREINLSIEDTGIGIPENEIPHLFEKFFRASGTENTTPGTGLGLSICKKIIEAHRGRIEVHSLVGQGSTFRIYLPGLKTS